MQKYNLLFLIVCFLQYAYCIKPNYVFDLNDFFDANLAIMQDIYGFGRSKGWLWDGDFGIEDIKEPDWWLNDVWIGNASDLVRMGNVQEEIDFSKRRFTFVANLGVNKLDMRASQVKFPYNNKLVNNAQFEIIKPVVYIKFQVRPKEGSDTTCILDHTYEIFNIDQALMTIDGKTTNVSMFFQMQVINFINEKLDEVVPPLHAYDEFDCLPPSHLFLQKLR